MYWLALGFNIYVHFNVIWARTFIFFIKYSISFLPKFITVPSYSSYLIIPLNYNKWKICFSQSLSSGIACQLIQWSNQGSNFWSIKGFWIRILFARRKGKKNEQITSCFINSFILFYYNKYKLPSLGQVNDIIFNIEN